LRLGDTLAGQCFLSIGKKIVIIIIVSVRTNKGRNKEKQTGGERRTSEDRKAKQKVIGE